MVYLAGIHQLSILKRTLANTSRFSGVRVYEDCKLLKVKSMNEKVKSVETTRGSIECKYFVNCTGFWARSVGKLSEPYVKVNKINKSRLSISYYVII